MELSIEEEEKPFIFKSYTKKELACMYSPSITPRCAIRIFTKWIKMNKELFRLLTIREHARSLPDKSELSPIFWTFLRNDRNILYERTEHIK